MVWSIIVTALSVLLCNVPSLVLGIIAAVKSSSANAKNASGDFMGAEANSDTAKTLDIIGTALLVIGAVFGIPFLIAFLYSFFSFGSAHR